MKNILSNLFCGINKSKPEPKQSYSYSDIVNMISEGHKELGIKISNYSFDEIPEVISKEEEDIYKAKRLLGFTNSKEVNEINIAITKRNSLIMQKEFTEQMKSFYEMISLKGLYLVNLETFLFDLLPKIGHFCINEVESYIGSTEKANIEKLSELLREPEIVKNLSVCYQDYDEDVLIKYCPTLNETSIILQNRNKLYIVTSPSLTSANYKKVFPILPITMVILYTKFGVLVCDMWEEKTGD